jgi:hypothetical protein
MGQIKTSVRLGEGRRKLKNPARTSPVCLSRPDAVRDPFRGGRPARDRRLMLLTRAPLVAPMHPRNCSRRHQCARIFNAIYTAFASCGEGLNPPKGALSPDVTAPETTPLVDSRGVRYFSFTYLGRRSYT